MFTCFFSTLNLEPRTSIVAFLIHTHTHTRTFTLHWWLSRWSTHKLACQSQTHSLLVFVVFKFCVFKKFLVFISTLDLIFFPLLPTFVLTWISRHSLGLTTDACHHLINFRKKLLISLKLLLPMISWKRPLPVLVVSHFGRPFLPLFCNHFNYFPS